MPDANFAKWPKPQKIARVILFLCSDDAKVIHDAAVPVYGDSGSVHVKRARHASPSTTSTGSVTG